MFDQMSHRWWRQFWGDRFRFILVEAEPLNLSSERVRILLLYDWILIHVVLGFMKGARVNTFERVFATLDIKQSIVGCFRLLTVGDAVGSPTPTLPNKPDFVSRKRIKTAGGRAREQDNFHNSRCAYIQRLYPTASPPLLVRPLALRRPTLLTYGYSFDCNSPWGTCHLSKLIGQ